MLNKKIMIGAGALCSALIATIVGVTYCNKKKNNKYDKKNDWFKTTAKAYNYGFKQYEEDMEILNECQDDELCFLLNEAKRAISEEIHQQMSIDSSYVEICYEQENSKIIKYAWKSGNDYFYKEFFLNDELKAAFPSFTVVNNRLVETFD